MVYSVFVTNRCVVESASYDVGTEAGFSVGELSDSDGESGCAELLVMVIEELVAIVELAATLVACTLRVVDPGWLKPGRPPELEFAIPRVVEAGEDTSVGDASGVPVSSPSGEYVNIGTSRLVALAVAFSTAAIELDKASELILLVLLLAGVGAWLGVIEVVGVVLELSSVVGAGLGVM